jgi:hypothetical protein
MAQGMWVVTSGSTSITANTPKYMVVLATGSTVSNDWTQLDVSFDGILSTSVPVRIDIWLTTQATTGGSAITYAAAHRANRGTLMDPQTTARVNDTTDGGTPVIVASWFVHPQSGVTYQFPLGREYGMGVSQFKGVKVTTPAAAATINCITNLWFAE